MTATARPRSHAAFARAQKLIPGGVNSPARAFGAVGLTADKKDQVPTVIEQMLAEKKCCVVDFHIEREENVWPMVAAGKGLHEMAGLPAETVERL